MAGSHHVRVILSNYMVRHKKVNVKIWMFNFFFKLRLIVRISCDIISTSVLRVGTRRGWGGSGSGMLAGNLSACQSCWKCRPCRLVLYVYAALSWNYFANTQRLRYVLWGISNDVTAKEKLYAGDSWHLTRTGNLWRWHGLKTIKQNRSNSFQFIGLKPHFDERRVFQIPRLVLRKRKEKKKKK